MERPSNDVSRDGSIPATRLVFSMGSGHRAPEGDVEEVLRTACAALLLLAGCATVPVERVSSPGSQAIPTLQGSYYRVRSGETLWGIARAFGIDVRGLAAANRLPDASQLKVGQQLFIPLPGESSRFLWPLRGSLGTSRGSKGVAIAAPPGSLVRAARTGQVAVATRQLSGWGKTVVLDHHDGYLTIYAGLEQLLVSPGAGIRQGVPVGTIGPRALHFEIRYGTMTKNALALLPEL